jgi:hypothetical protein
VDPVSIIYAVAMLVASYAITALTTRRPPDAKPAQLQDFDFPQHEEGTPQAVIFGDCWTDDWMVLWYGNYRVEPIKKRMSKKKK